MTSTNAVARAVARDAERRARTALDDVLAAHTALRNADTTLAAATQAKAAAGPALARAITAATAAGITPEQLADLGITTPSPRTLRRRRTRTPAPGPGAAPAPGTAQHSEADTCPAEPGSPPPDDHGHAPAVEVASSW